MGSTHDATGWAVSGIGRTIADEGIAGNYYIVADDAYPNGEYILTPFPGDDLPDFKDNFNFFQSKARINIECAFGMLARRWCILWRRMDLVPEKASLVVMVCMKMHNVCIDFQLPDYGDCERGRKTGLWDTHDAEDIWLQRACQEDLDPEIGPEARRDAVAIAIRDAGGIRPDRSNYTRRQRRRLN